MKRNVVFLLLLVFISAIVNAQFTDTMESYTEGNPIFEGHWTDWGCGGGEGCAIMSTSEVVYSGNLSGLIPDDGTTDAVLDLGNKVFGHWRLEFWLYVPSGKEANWIIKSCVPICTEDWGIYMVFNQDNLNPGEGFISNTILGQLDFTFPHDTWFRVYMDWDVNLGISLATWNMLINDVEVIPVNTPYKNELSESPNSIGGIGFFSITPGISTFYIDNVIFCDEFDPPGACTILITDDVEESLFKVYPNPIINNLNIQANQKITSVIVYNILGQEIDNSKLDTFNFRLEMSDFNNGIYFVKITIENAYQTIKVIKQ